MYCKKYTILYYIVDIFIMHYTILEYLKLNIYDFLKIVLILMSEL